MTKTLEKTQSKNGAGGETRTRKGLPPVDFELVSWTSAASGLVIDFVACVKNVVSEIAPNIALSPAYIPHNARRRQ